ncbi:tetratricopeptide repeat protein 4 isoform X2 [Ambystoma mexicanum]|uniref:tetratricopeptide repeat protein 4 isoform X2 n=1 Tax=Ambystoma mexicanum TaxID=8296 RepID=UPI0037E967B3
MASPEEDDVMDEFMDKFKAQKYEGAFKEDTWEEEFDKIPIFLKKAPTEIDPEKNPDLACLQSILFDADRSPEEQAKSYKDEGNDYFKEKNYKKAIISYTEGLNMKSTNLDLNAILYTNRAAAQFHLGALCHLEMKHFTEAITWCDEGLEIDPKEKSLLETRARADKLERAKQRDERKEKLKEKREQAERLAVIKAIKERKIKLFPKPSNVMNDDIAMSDSLNELSLDERGFENVPGGKVRLDDNGRLIWPVLFLYPEYGQTDFIAAFHEESRFIDHLIVMFGDELPPWDLERKYHASNLELYFEDEETRQIYQVDTESTLLHALQQSRYFVKAGTPAFILFAKQSSFCLNYLSHKKVHRAR